MACNGCHDLTTLSVNISDIAIITIKNVDYHCIIRNITKCEAIYLLKNSGLGNRGYTQKVLTYFLAYSKEFFFYFFCFSIYKMVDGMDIYKHLNVTLGTVMKNLEMLKFVPDHLKNEKMCKHAFKKLPYLLRYVPAQYKTQ